MSELKLRPPESIYEMTASDWESRRWRTGLDWSSNE
jgi:hypothetical protein